MPFDHKFLQMLFELHNKAVADQVNWQRGEDFVLADKVIGTEYTVRFPSSVLSISRVSPPNETGHIVVKLSTTDGKLLKTIREEPNGPNWVVLNEVFERASNSSVYSDPFVDRILDEIRSSPRVGEAPLLPVDPAVAFLKMVAGKWRLTFAVNQQEELRIDEKGNYWILRSDASEVRVFTLERILFETSTNHVSFDKVDTGEQNNPKFPKGHLRQREVLDINSDGTLMTGYAEQGRQSLEYRRLKSLGQKREG